VRFGWRNIYLQRLLRPDAAALLGLLWGVWTRTSPLPAPPPPGITSFPAADMPAAFLAASGFFVAGGRAVRYDMLERLEDAVEKGNDDAQLLSLIGSSRDELHAVLGALGWRTTPEGWRRIRRKRRRPSDRRTDTEASSPFAGLAALKRAK
jgi:ATP-dependent RNA helicase SUPV3L1/SUV3